LHIGELDVGFPVLLMAGDVYISDLHGDTLLYANKLAVDLSRFVNKNRRMEIQAISLYHGRFRLVQYPGEKDLNVQFLIDAFDTGPAPKGLKPFVNMVRHIELNDVHFTYEDLPLDNEKEEIDFSDLDCRNLYLSVDSLTIIKEQFHMEVKHATLTEKSGFYVRDLSTSLGISPEFVDMKRMHLQTLRSDVTGDFSFLTNDYDDYSDFEEKVRLSGNFSPSRLWLADLTPFATELKGMNRSIGFSGRVWGTESNLKGKNLVITYGLTTRFAGDVSFKGLPNWENTFTSLEIQSLVTDANDLLTIPQYPFTSYKTLQVPREVKRMGKIFYSGSFDGFESDFVSYGNMNCDLGALTMDIEMKTDPSDGVANYKGNLRSKGFDLGKYFGVDHILTTLAMDVYVEGRGLKQSNVNTKVNGNIGHMNLYGYDYHNLNVNGNFSKNIFTGTFGVKDENADLQFDGDIDLRGSLPRFQFTSQINNLNLNGLHLVSGENRYSLSSKLSIDITGDSPDNITGTAEAEQTLEYKNDEASLIKRIKLSSDINEGKRRLQLQSDVADGSMEGAFSFSEMPALFNYILYKQFPSYMDSCGKIVLPENFSWDFTTKNSMAVSRMLLPGIVLYPNTAFRGKIENNGNAYSMQFLAPRLVLQGFSFSGTQLEVNSSPTPEFRISCERISLTSSASVENLVLSGKAFTDSLQIDLDWKNLNGKKNYGDLTAGIRFDKGKKLGLSVTRDQLYIMDTLWKFDPGNRLVMDTTGAYFSNFFVQASKERLGIETVSHPNGTHTQKIFFDEFEMAWLNPLIEKSGTTLKGIINGSGTFTNNEGHLVFSSSLAMTGLAINDEVFGNASMIALYNDKDESIAINAKIMRGESPALSVSGFYYPTREKESLDMEIQLLQFPIRNLEGYVKDVFSDIRGYAGGSLILSGNASKPVLRGEIEVMRGGCKVDYLNVDYTFSDKVYFLENRIEFRDMRFTDSKGKYGVLNGAITHDYFDDLRLKLDLDVKKLMCLNLTPSQNQTVYGKAFVTGIAHISGKLNALVFDINARSESGTILNIPLYGAEEIRQNDLIQFINHDTSTISIRKSRRTDSNGIQLNFDLQMTPDADIQLIFDPKVGDVISGKGDGNIKMNINTNGQFQMFGNYTITDGKYLFTLQNIINKKFIVGNGSTITWNGDPFGADININAVYKLRTSLSDILPDSSRQRVPVDCMLYMTDKLLKPTIKFDIQLPNSDQRRREEMRAAVNMDNEAELNKQVFSLLMLGSFFPASEKNNNSVTSGVSSNTNELVSNQVSNWLSGISKKVNLGFNYKSDQVSNREMQLSLSKELFNSRVNIDGNVGVTNNPSAASNIIGDVNIDYKVSRDGRFRVRAYHQSNQYYALTNNSPYTQGLGVFYREEFENLPDLYNKYKNILLLRRQKESE
jgi:hypothetical protein